MLHTPEQVSVLLVEDEPLLSALMANALDEHGFAVHATARGDDALRYVNAGAAVDALFTEIYLPGDIDGTELAIRVRALRPELPIVYASGRDGESVIERMVSRSLFMPKPYRPTEVCRLLVRLTDAPN